MYKTTIIRFEKINHFYNTYNGRNANEKCWCDFNRTIFRDEYFIANVESSSMENLSQTENSSRSSEVK